MGKFNSMFNRDNFLFSSWFMGVLFILFAVSMAFATFIENDYGQMAAREIVYDAKWFELIILLLVVNFIGHLFRFKLYRRSQLPRMTFHIAFILIIIGAAITRYIGFEGSIHLREGESKSSIKTEDQYIKLKVTDKNNKNLYSSSDKFVVTPVISDNYDEDIKVEEQEYNIQYKGYIAEAAKSIADDPNGKPLIQMMITRDMEKTHRLVLEDGQHTNIADFTFGLNTAEDADIQIEQNGDGFIMHSPWDVQRFDINDRVPENFTNDESIPLEDMFVYSINGWRILVEDITPSGIIKPVRAKQGSPQNQDVLHYELKNNKNTSDMFLWLNEDSSSVARFANEDHIVKLNYAPKAIKLPFSIKLNEFVMEKYPGSDAPSSYKSNVTVIDRQNDKEFSYMVYMNNILKYRGYRFFQSSYDQDEKGSILSVNYDVAGMSVTYAGYILLVIGIVLSLLNRKSLFRKVNKKFWPAPVRKTTAVMILFLLFGSSASHSSGQRFETDKKVAEEFGDVLVQDQKGRTKPLYTLSHEILRKVSRDNSYRGFSPVQVFLGLYYDFENWKNVPLIKVNNKEVQKLLGLKNDYAAFTDIVSPGKNQYKLDEYVRKAYSKAAGERNKFDKEVMKVDERLNICFMVMQGEFLRIFPYENDEGEWTTPGKISEHVENNEDLLQFENVMTRVEKNISRENYDKALELISSIKEYQRRHARYELPSEKKVDTEIIFHKGRVFERLFPFLATTGILLIGLLLVRIIKGQKIAPGLVKVFVGLIAVGFLFQTIGLGLRWYISGHAPMSNGYESMLFVSWATLLAGFLFFRKSKLTLAATSVLAAFALMVAHMGFMDPEITNLMPVLQSYWLTLHVSIITSSYGFLGLSAILGLMNLVFFLLVSRSNHSRIVSSIQELTVINYKAMTIGLYLLTIGTFLGAIWANESWGRYWGWDPKETWSLITIIVYSFIMHARIIPGLKTLFTFNVMALFGFSSVLMTYFGVNYYLSGLHSYAGGDPVPIPAFVYVSVILLVTLTVVSYIHKKKILVVSEEH
ncbi:MAG: c-type cytochrome biogenesis protein CcsB [Bacteroidales bacterium]